MKRFRGVGILPLLVPFFLFPALFSCTIPGRGRGECSPEQVGRQVIENLLARPDLMIYQTPQAHGIHYAEACAGFGAARLAGALKDPVLLKKLVQRYAIERTDTIPNSANHVDVNVYGILPLELYRVGMGTAFREQGMRLADGQWEDPLPDGLTRQVRFWIDDIWMIASLQVQAYRVTGEAEYLERTARVVAAYLERLQQPNGLFYHGTDGPFFWGRGNGWVAAGLAELLTELPQSDLHYSAILEGYSRMMKALLRHQGEDGLWGQLIDHPGSFRETSGSAMFGYAMQVGVQQGLLPRRPYRRAVDRAWKGLGRYLNEDGTLREVCVGTGQSTDVNFYLTRPRVTGDLHGQAPMLWFAASLLTE